VLRPTSARADQAERPLECRASPDTLQGERNKIRNPSASAPLRFPTGAAFVSAALALLLQGLLPRYFPPATLLELPLLVTVYFSLRVHNRSAGILWGTTVGLLQDAVSHLQLGIYGIALAAVGYLAAWVGRWFVVEHPLFRITVVLFLGLLEHALVAFIRSTLLDQPETLAGWRWPLGVLVTAVLAWPIFVLLDRRLAGSS
jgi:rod shape-determining protein MreD